MKILVVHNKYKEKGGEDNSFAAECKMLSQYGHDVRTLVFNNEQISTWKEVAKLSYRIFYNPESARMLNELIDEFHPDIIHVHNFFYVASPSLFYVAHQRNIPVLFTVRNFRLICSGALLLRNGKTCELCVNSQLPLHGIIHACHRNSRLQTAQLTFMTSYHKMVGTWRNKITKYVVLTDFAKKKLLSSSLGLSPDQIVVKPNCVTDLGYKAYDERGDYYLFVGRLSTEKGLDTLLKARDYTPFRLKIIGEGPLTPLVEEYAQKYPDIEYLGFRDNNFIIETLKEARALLFPSIWYEGLPRTILESFSTGTPIICSDIDNVNEIVTNRVNGLHFPTSDAKGLADILKVFQPEAEQFKALYANARATFIEMYTYEGNYKQLIKIYKELATKEYDTNDNEVVKVG